MKFFIDHNLSPQLIKPILAIHPRHTFLCALEEQLTKTDDIPLFSELVKRGFEAIITRDRNQLPMTTNGLPSWPAVCTGSVSKTPMCPGCWELHWTRRQSPSA